MRSFLTLACESTVIDQTTNNTSLFNVFEVLTAKTFPVAHPKITFFTYLERDPEEPELIESVLKLKLNRKTIREYPMQIDFRGALKTRLIVTLTAVMLPAPGVLVLSLLHGKDRLAAYKVDVVASD